MDLLSTSIMNRGKDRDSHRIVDFVTLGICENQI